MHQSRIRVRSVKRLIIYCRFPETVCSVLLIFAGVAAFAQAVSKGAAKVPGPVHVESRDPKRAVGYLSDAEPNYLLLLPPYPALDSKQDKIDVATFRQMQVSDSSARWRLAEADDRMTYARFSGALGIDLDAGKLPIVVHLLNRMERDALDTAFAAKSHFNRPRPFQRFAVAHVCGADTPPKPEAHPNGGSSASSYPSGHSAFGWSAALTLAEICARSCSVDPGARARIRRKQGGMRCPLPERCCSR